MRNTLTDQRGVFYGERSRAVHHWFPKDKKKKREREKKKKKSRCKTLLLRPLLLLF
jgi:hypothetical protein